MVVGAVAWDENLQLELVRFKASSDLHYMWSHMQMHTQTVAEVPHFSHSVDSKRFHELPLSKSC